MKGNKPVLFLKAARGADAIGMKTRDGIVVLQNSRVAINVDDAFPLPLKNLRSKLIKEEIIVQKDGQFLFDIEYLFSDPSTAASIVMGTDADGLKEWKTRDGKSLKDIETG